MPDLLTILLEFGVTLGVWGLAIVFLLTVVVLLAFSRMDRRSKNILIALTLIPALLGCCCNAIFIAGVSQQTASIPELATGTRSVSVIVTIIAVAMIIAALTLALIYNKWNWKGVLIGFAFWSVFGCCLAIGIMALFMGIFPQGLGIILPTPIP